MDQQPFRIFNEYTNGSRRVNSTALEQILTRDLEPTNGDIDAGYTYLGQMLSHDIISPSGGEGRQCRPLLLLDSLYANPIDLSLFDKQSFFLTGRDHSGIADKDLFRDHQNVAHIPELRNDENLIVSQLHLLWQRIHNKLVAFSYRSKPNLDGVARLLEVRRIVVHLFQRIVIEDYLRKLLNPEVYKVYFEQDQKFLIQHTKLINTVPIEFSHAAFRIGHSMVRPRYQLQVGGEEIDLAELMDINNFPITSNKVIDWSVFFETDNTIQPQSSSGLDLKISSAMTSIPCLKGKQGCMARTDIVETNLARGREQNLPYPEDIIEKWRSSGADIIDECFFQPNDYRIIKVEDQFSPFRSGDFTDNKIPFWLYMLLEAEINEDTKNLGKFASVIVAETIAYATNRQITDGHIGELATQVPLSDCPLLTMPKIINWLNK